MSNVIRIRKGLDIKLEGAAPLNMASLPLADSYAVKPDDFVGFTPKLLVQPGDKVQAGSPLLFDKYRPEILVTSPVSGTVSAVNRGEKRKILEVVVVPDAEVSYLDFEVGSPKSLSKEEITERMLQSGLWPLLTQRPYGVMADPAATPKAIFISGFDSAPLAPSMDYILSHEEENLNAGIEALSKLTSGKVHLSLHTDSDTSFLGKTLTFLDTGSTTRPCSAEESVLTRVKGVKTHWFSGPHPAGNVGIQIHHIDPINKGDIVWTIDVQDLAILGRFFRTGRVDMTRTIAVTGSEVDFPHYVKLIGGASISSILKNNLGNTNPKEIRIISGNVLTGKKVEMNGYLGFHSNQITVIPEGNHYEFLGWIAPRFNKFSVSRTYFSWLMPWKQYNLDTNLNGGERAFIFNGIYDQYLPMDIYPVYLLKAIVAEDIDKMENLGIYEVIEEDLALCEFIDPSKTEMQALIRKGINQMIKELN